MSKSSLLIINAPPYSGSDTVWNALRHAKTAAGYDDKARVFLMNDGADTGRKELKPPENFFNLAEMLAEVAKEDAEALYCKTCIDRCDIGEGEMIKEIKPGSMALLHEWVSNSDKIVSF